MTYQLQALGLIGLPENQNRVLVVQAGGAAMVDDDRGYGEIEAQVGRGAGNIAATNFHYHTWLTESLSGAARAMQLSLRSAWLLVEIWNNGATVWQSPDGDQRATITPEGEIQVERGAHGHNAEQLAPDAR